MTITMDAHVWAEEQFGQCELKDEQRTQRLVQVAAALSHPSGSFPEQTSDAADLKAAYRLFGCEDVAFEDIAGPHWAQTVGDHRTSTWYSTIPPKWTSASAASLVVWDRPATAEAGVSCCIRHCSSAEKAKRSSAWRARIRYRKPAPKAGNSRRTGSCVSRKNNVAASCPTDRP